MEARPLGPAGGGGLGRCGGWWAGESAGTSMEKPAFYPAEGRGGELVGVSSLRKVTGVLSQGYLGAGIRRRLAPKKAKDLTLK